MLHNTWQYLPF